MPKGIHDKVRTWVVSSRSSSSRYCLDLEHARIDVAPEELTVEDRQKVRALLEELAKAVH